MKLFNRLIPLRFRIGRRDPRVAALYERVSASGFDFSRFEQTIGYAPQRWELFFEALLHRSYLQFAGKEWHSNERLEFLGDSILNSIVAEYLFETYPNDEEGVLTKYRARLVNRKTLCQRAREMRLMDFLLLSNSAAQSIDGGSESILADAFESILGAIYLDGGVEAAHDFVHSRLLSHPESLSNAHLDDNYKSALLEYSQGKAYGIPRYSVIKEDGPEHDRRFTVEVVVGGQPLGTGSGRSKKDAEQAAAQQALERIQREPLIIQDQVKQP